MGDASVTLLHAAASTSIAAAASIVYCATLSAYLGLFILNRERLQSLVILLSVL